MLELNRDFSKIWPSIVEIKPAPENADDFLNVENKFKTSFSDKPGQ